jgi:asparagine synthase (glutamine-hydrolysing)
VLSASPDVLVRQPGVSGDADAVALSEWVCGWFPAVEDTAYREVKRVPPASAITFEESGATVSRYWDPFSDVGNLQWLSEQDLDQFEPLLDQAVTRAMQGLPSSVFLSGGVDSISVAVTAADLARRTRTSDPLALSLGFPEGESNEEAIQRGVASQLGLEQILVPLEKASGHRGLLDEALRSSADWPQPMWNVWSPAYMTLARHAADAGRRVVLTGRGGDEWLTISPYLLADQIGRGDWRGAWRLIQMRRRSNNLAGMRQMSWLLWTTAGRPLASAALDAVAPGPWHRQRRRRLLSERPAWVAPDPAVRRAMDERIERWMDPARPAGGFYLREAQTAVRHTAVTQDMEETHEFGRRNGLRVMHPYWDVDLVDMLYRVPPRLLMADGRAKSLVRSRLAKRLPGLGLERRGKVNAGYVFHNIMEREAPALWTRMNGLEALGRIGVVDSAGIESARQARQWRLTRGRLWTLMTFESWTRRRV